MRLSLIFILGLCASASAVALLWIGELLMMGRGPDLEIFAASAGYAVLFFAMAICCAIAMEHHRLLRLMRTGLYGALLAWIGWVVWVWTGDYYLRMALPIEKFVIWPSVWAGLMAMVGLLFLSVGRQPWWRGIRLATLVLLCLMAAHVALGTTLYPVFPQTDSTEERDVYYSTIHAYEEYLSRIGGALGLLSIAGVSATFLLLWLMPNKRDQLVAPIPYSLTCPRCSAEQTRHTGWDRCGSCGLEICVTC